MTRTAAPLEFLQINMEQALPGIAEADRLAMTGLAQAALALHADTLQSVLDQATYAPIAIGNFLRDEKPSDWTEAEWRGLQAAHTAVSSNVALRLTPSAEAEAALHDDQIYMARRHTMHLSSGDRDRFRQAGSAKLWGLARYIAGHPVRRLIGDYNGQQWGQVVYRAVE